MLSGTPVAPRCGAVVLGVAGDVGVGARRRFGDIMRHWASGGVLIMPLNLEWAHVGGLASGSGMRFHFTGTDARWRSLIVGIVVPDASAHHHAAAGHLQRAHLGMNFPRPGAKAETAGRHERAFRNECVVIADRKSVLVSGTIIENGIAAADAGGRIEERWALEYLFRRVIARASIEQVGKIGVRHLNTKTAQGSGYIVSFRRKLLRKCRERNQTQGQKSGDKQTLHEKKTS